MRRCPRWCWHVWPALAVACNAAPREEAVWRAEALSAAPAAAEVEGERTPDALFETMQVRPLALSPGGRLLFAVNSPDHRLEILGVTDGGLTPLGSVSVGLEPVAVAARSDREAWVVNHLSDSISVVRVEPDGSGEVVRTLYVGDEPRDIVFAGKNRERAFITTAHRGQNSPDDPELFNPAAGRADVWVFDADHLGESLAGERLAKLTLFADTPRALAVSPDGTRVYAAAFLSGNQTTTASADAVRHVYAELVDPANPDRFLYGTEKRALTGRVVRRRAAADGAVHWLDAEGRSFDDWVRVSLPDYDVFTIDAAADPPAAIASGTFAHVGTVLFDMAVNPKSGKVYVSNTEAHNDVRFEGHNPSPITSVRGSAVDSRITVLDPARAALAYADLNPDAALGAGAARRSLAFPQGLSVTADGKQLYVVAQGSAKVGIYDTAELEAGRAEPNESRQIRLSAGGPTGIVLDEPRRRAYVLTRFDDGISTLDLDRRIEADHLALYNPEPERVTRGRRFLYDAASTSDSGTQACSGCHVGGDLDGLAWDLGNPGGLPLPISKDAASETAIWTFPPSVIKSMLPQTAELFESYSELKGPLTTQSLRGLDNHGGMHWRGDRNGAVAPSGAPFVDADGAPVVTAQPSGGMFDERAAFASFNVAFPGLIGRSEPLPAGDMAAFTDFALEITYPPNPIRSLDDSLTAVEQRGRDMYFQTDAGGNELPVDRLHNCNGCHTLDREGNTGHSRHPGFFGTSGRLSFENLPQVFKVAHLRNAYQKVGMFASSPDANRSLTPNLAFNPPLPAVRGFGYQPDGAVGSLEHHLTGRGFIKTDLPVPVVGPNPGGIPTFSFDAAGNPIGIDPAGFEVRRALASFVFAYDSNLRPIVGQQATLGARSSADVAARIDLFEARVRAGDCDLVAKAHGEEREHGYLYDGAAFATDRASEPLLSDRELRELAEGEGNVTFTCVPPGSGRRIGLDRDLDGTLDGDEPPSPARR